MNDINESNANTNLESTSKIRVQESDVQEIIKMMKADLNESSRCEKLEENKFDCSQSIVKLESTQMEELPTSTQQPATSSLNKIENDEHVNDFHANDVNDDNDDDDEAEAARTFKHVNNNSNYYDEVDKANLLMDNFDEDYEQDRVSSVLTKTTVTIHKIDYQTANDNNYDIISDINQLKLSKNFNKEQIDDDIENDSGLNSARSLAKKSIAQCNDSHKQPEEDWNSFNENTDSNLVEFINKARDFGANALDLSKKNLVKLPRELIDLNDLQYIYLEGNNIEKLPNNFFVIFSNLKWLDLRNNKLTELPSNGLDKHIHLRYLLLENNKLKSLPNEIANLRHLTALNLSDNPLEYPSQDIIKKGCRYVQDFLRTKLIQQKYESMKNKSNVNDTRALMHDDYADESDERDIPIYGDDVWASDDEQDRQPRLKSRLSKSATRFAPNQLENCSSFCYYRGGSARLDTATRNLLIAQSIQPAEADMQNNILRQRLIKAKLNANELSKNSLKLLTKRKSLPPAPPLNDKSLYKNEQLEKALKTGKVEKYKLQKDKIDSKIQKVNDHVMLDDFRNDMKTKQRKLFNKRLVKGVDYIEPALKAPFDISENHLTVMTNEERAYYDAKLEQQLRQPLSPDTLWRIEEERRIRDNVLQEKIREYTKKIMARRNKPNSIAKNDRLQAEKDIRELKKLEKELENRRIELQHNIRSNTGSIVYREMAKLNKKATLAAILKKE